MKLYGTTTSPYVRRVRIVAAELGLPFELLDTTTQEGQEALRAVNPLWKVPTVVVGGGQVIFDSHVIIEHLLRQHGHGPLRPVAADPDGWLREQKLIAAIDAALDTAINVFYFHRDGVDVDSIPYLVKQRDRVRSILHWLEPELRGSWLTGEPRLGVAEIVLVSALDWLCFRDRYPVDAHPAFAAFRAAHADRPSVRSTRPTG
jgi:glutathione S-transferase